jgi:hypothetical protein
MSLSEINRMEREFLLGVDFNLYVDQTTYASRLNLLKGLVLAKERNARRLLHGGGMRVLSSAREAWAVEEKGGSGTHINLTMEITHMVRIPDGSTGPANRTFTTAAGNAAAMDLFQRVGNQHILLRV